MPVCNNQRVEYSGRVVLVSTRRANAEYANGYPAHEVGGAPTYRSSESAARWPRQIREKSDAIDWKSAVVERGDRHTTDNNNACHV